LEAGGTAVAAVAPFALADCGVGEGGGGGMPERCGWAKDALAPAKAASRMLVRIVVPVRFVFIINGLFIAGGVRRFCGDGGGCEREIGSASRRARSPVQPPPHAKESARGAWLRVSA
jgi:hypothetical protein